MSPNNYVDCPHCGALAGLPCVTASGSTTKPHAHRLTREQYELSHQTMPERVATVAAAAVEQTKGDGVYRGLHRGKPVNGRVVGITPVAKGQMVQSPRHATRKRKQAERRARRLSARGNGGGKRA